MTRRRFGIFGKPSDQDASEPAPEVESTDTHQEPADTLQDPVHDHEEGMDPVTPALGEPDPAERVRAAAESAADRAEHRTTDELLALEQELERARGQTAEQVEAVHGRLPEVEHRAAEAERQAAEAEHRATEAVRRAERAERALAEAEQQPESRPGAELGAGPAETVDAARAGAANWLREQLAVFSQEADERLARAVEAAERAAGERARSAGGEGAAEAKAGDQPGDAAARLQTELDAAGTRLERSEAELEALRSQLERARAEAIEARAEAMHAEANAEQSARQDVERQVEARTATLRDELETLRASRTAEPSETDETAQVPSGSIEAEAELRVELARTRAELERTRDELERARADRSRTIESADRRLREIEQQALDAADLIAAAEVELRLEGQRLRAARGSTAGGEPTPGETATPEPS